MRVIANWTSPDRQNNICESEKKCYEYHVKTQTILTRSCSDKKQNQFKPIDFKN